MPPMTPGGVTGSMTPGSRPRVQVRTSSITNMLQHCGGRSTAPSVGIARGGESVQSSAKYDVRMVPGRTLRIPAMRGPACSRSLGATASAPEPMTALRDRGRRCDLTRLILRGWQSSMYEFNRAMDTQEGMYRCRRPSRPPGPSAVTAVLPPLLED